MVSLSESIPLATVPKRVRKKLADGEHLNLARIGRELDPPVSKVSVSQVFSGRSTSKRIQAAIEKELGEILVPGNAYGWWPGQEK